MISLALGLIYGAIGFCVALSMVRWLDAPDDNPFTLMILAALWPGVVLILMVALSGEGLVWAAFRVRRGGAE